MGVHGDGRAQHGERAGLITGALPAALDNRKVLVLEKESEIGGRIISEHKPFENFILDSAWHGVSAGSRNRYSVLAKALGKSIPTVNQVGLLVRHEGEFVELSEIVKSGTSAAAHCGILCANAVTGRDFLTLLPEFMR